MNAKTKAQRPGKLSVESLIDECYALLSEPVDLTDVDPELHAEHDARVMEERVTAYLEGRDDKLQLLRHVRGAAQDRAARFTAEADRLTRRAKRSTSLATFCVDQVMCLLQHERAAQGLGEGDRYKADHGDGWAGIRVSRPKRAEVDDVNELPRSLLRVQDPKPDKAAILKRLKLGQVVPGARLVEGISETVDWSR